MGEWQSFWQLLFGSHALLAVVVRAGAVCNVLAFGAVEDNRTEDTAALARALTACAPGGSVILPAGRTFLLRPVRLPSHVLLQVDGDLQPGVTLLPGQTPRPSFVRPPHTRHHARRFAAIFFCCSIGQSIVLSPRV